MELAFIKTPAGIIVPAEGQTTDVVASLKAGEVLRGDYRKARNYRFHRKYFALLDLAYDYFEPEAVQTAQGWIKPEKNREEFRKWCTVKAGFYHIVGYPDGGVRLRARSIAFARMDQADFEKLYSATIDVLLQRVFDHKWSREKVDQAVNRILNFC
ncbi:DUF1367 family protein [Endozoicomonas sp. Mp262]|uniref:DUF1367 family protein n=1 Tax=Endozoicomonas sp. Mp262 TaxID=2919499 RepID=UPI0021D8E47F